MNSSLEDALLNFENRRFLDAERQCAAALEAEPGNATVHVAGAIGLDVWTLVPDGAGSAMALVSRPVRLLVVPVDETLPATECRELVSAPFRRTARTRGLDS